MPRRTEGNATATARPDFAQHLQVLDPEPPGVQDVLHRTSYVARASSSGPSCSPRKPFSAQPRELSGSGAGSCTARPAGPSAQWRTGGLGGGAGGAARGCRAAVEGGFEFRAPAPALLGVVARLGLSFFATPLILHFSLNQPWGWIGVILLSLSLQGLSWQHLNQP